MAIGITLLYILAELLGPPELFGSLTEYRVELILSIIAIIVTIPNLSSSQLFRSRVLLALAGLVFSIACSIALGGWLGGVFYIGYGFLPVLLGFILVAVNCKTKRHLQLVILVLFAGCAFDVMMGLLGLMRGGETPYVLVQGVDVFTTLPRIRGLEFINDPNDFAQLMVALIPLLFFFWRKGQPFPSVMLVGPPLAVLLVGTYYTRSRGGVIALMATVVVAARRKIGLVPAAVIGGIIFLGALAAGMSGGREISAESGADRIELWAIGTHLVKLHPLFGVGLGSFREYAPNTAHNSVVICAAELGIIGLLFWVMFIFTTVRGGLLLGRKPEAAEEQESAAEPAEGVFSPGGIGTLSGTAQPGQSQWVLTQRTQTSPALAQQLAGSFPVLPVASATPAPWRNPLQPQNQTSDEEEIRRLARLIIYSLTGFLTAGWFLSRALSIWLFIICAFMHVVLRMAAEGGVAPKPDSLGFLLRWSTIIALAALTVVSIIIRFSH